MNNPTAFAAAHAKYAEMADALRAGHIEDSAENLAACEHLRQEANALRPEPENLGRKVDAEDFWSEVSADAAAARLQRKGYRTRVSCIGGPRDWLLEVFVPVDAEMA